MSFVKGDIVDRALLDRVFAEHAPRAVVHFAAESHVDRSASTVLVTSFKTNIVGTLQFAGSRCARSWMRACPKATPRRDFRFLPRLHRRGLWLACRPTLPRLRRNPPLRAQQPLQRQQGRQRPLGARMAPHLRLAGAHHQLLEQLRAVSTSPEKLIPLMIDQRAWPASRCRSTVTACKSATGSTCKDHCSAIRRRARSRSVWVGEVYNVGGWNEKPNIEIVQHRVCVAGRAGGRANRRQTLRASKSPARDRPPGPRPPLRHRRAQARSASWAGSPAETFETGIRKTVQWYLRQPRAWVANVQSGGLQRLGGPATTPEAPSEAPHARLWQKRPSGHVGAFDSAAWRSFDGKLLLPWIATARSASRVDEEARWPR